MVHEKRRPKFIQNALAQTHDHSELHFCHVHWTSSSARLHRTLRTLTEYPHVGEGILHDFPQSIWRTLPPARTEMATGPTLAAHTSQVHISKAVWSTSLRVSHRPRRPQRQGERTSASLQSKTAPKNSASRSVIGRNGGS